MPLFLGLGLFLFFAYITHGKNHDLLIDYGREVYTAWRISEGDLLYKDIARPYGPLGAHIGAMAFLLFGDNYSSLSTFLLLLNAAFLFYIYWQYDRMGIRWSGLIVIMFIMVYFSFNSLNNLGIFNGIKPYSIDVVVGFFLNVIIFVELMKKRSTGIHNSMSFLMGSLLAFIILTKPEFILNSCVFFILYCYIYYRSHSLIILYRFVLFIAIGFFITMTILYGISSYVYGMEYAIQVIIKAISTTLHPASSELRPFLYYITGFDNLYNNMIYNISYGIKLIFYILLVILCTYSLKHKQHYYYYISTGILSVFSIIMAFEIDWENIGMSLPLFSLIAIIYGVIHNKSRNSLLLIIGGFISIIFMSKIILKADVFGYGFVLCLPALVLLIYVLLNYPYMNHITIHTKIPFITFLLSHLFITIRQEIYNLSLYKYPFIKGENVEFYANTELAVGLSQLVNSNIIKKGSTMLVLPEGNIINYFTSTSTASFITSLNPHDWALLGGEDSVAHIIMNHLPEYILWLPRDYSEYRYPRFGTIPEFGLSVRDISECYYQLIAQWKSDPRYSDDIGFVLLKYSGK